MTLGYLLLRERSDPGSSPWVITVTLNTAKAGVFTFSKSSTDAILILLLNLLNKPQIKG